MTSTAALPAPRKLLRQLRSAKVCSCVGCDGRGEFCRLTARRRDRRASPLLSDSGTLPGCGCSAVSPNAFAARQRRSRRCSGSRLRLGYLRRREWADERGVLVDGSRAAPGAGAIG